MQGPDLLALKGSNQPVIAYLKFRVSGFGVVWKSEVERNLWGLFIPESFASVGMESCAETSTWIARRL